MSLTGSNGLRRRAARLAAGGAAVSAALAGGMMAAPAAMAAPSAPAVVTIPVPCSTTALRTAIFFAPSNAILVLVRGCTYFVTSALPDVRRNLTIVGSNDAIVARANNFTILENDGPNLAISNLTFADGDGRGSDPGAILNDTTGALSLTSVTFSHNDGGTGGAIFNSLGASLTISSCTFIDNKSFGAGGGAIANGPGSTTTLSGSTFIGNEAARPDDSVVASVSGGDGGAIASLGGTVTVQAPQSFFSHNFADDEGGAIASLLGTLNISNASFTDNESDDDGGAVANFGAVATINQSVFTGNESGEDGGAVATGTTTNLTGDTFRLNRAHRRGGALFVDGGTSTLDTTDIFTNIAFGSGFSGGGIYRAGGTVTFVNNVHVSLNAPNNCTNVICPL